MLNTQQDASDQSSMTDSGQTTPTPSSISIDAIKATRQEPNSPTEDVIIFKSSQKESRPVTSVRIKKPRPQSHPPSILHPIITTPVKLPNKELALPTPPNSDSKVNASGAYSVEVVSGEDMDPPIAKLSIDDILRSGVVLDGTEDDVTSSSSQRQTKDANMPVIMSTKEVQSSSTMPDPLHNPNNTTNVYINGLRPFFSQAELIKLASMFGKVLSCRVFHRFNHNVRGQPDGTDQQGSTYAFVLYSTLEDAERCIRALLKYSDLHPSFARTQRLPGSRGGLISESLESETLLRSAEKAVAASRDMGSSTSSMYSDRGSTEVLIQGLPRSATREVVESLLRPHVAQDIRLLPLGTESSNDSRLVAYVRLPSQHAVDETIERLHNRSVAGWTDRESSVKLHVVVTNPVEAQIPTPPSSGNSTSQFSVQQGSQRIVPPAGASHQLAPPFELSGMHPWMAGAYGGRNPHVPPVSPYSTQFTHHHHHQPTSSSNSPPQPFHPTSSPTPSTAFPSHVSSTMSPFSFVNRLQGAQPPNIPIHQYPILHPNGVQFVPADIPLGGLPLPPSYYNIPGVGLGGEQHHAQYQSNVPPSPGVGMGQHFPSSTAFLQSPFNDRFGQQRGGMSLPLRPQEGGYPMHPPSTTPSYSGHVPYQTPMRRFYPRKVDGAIPIVHPGSGGVGQGGGGSHHQTPLQVGGYSIPTTFNQNTPDHGSQSGVPAAGGSHASSYAHRAGVQNSGSRWKGKAKA